MTLHALSNPRAKRDAALIHAIESIPQEGTMTPEFQESIGDQNRDNVRNILEKLVKAGVLTAKRPTMRRAIYFRAPNWRNAFDDYVTKRDAYINRGKEVPELQGGPMVNHAIQNLPALHRVWM